MLYQKYRVRIKSIIKLKLALLTFGSISVLTIVLWFFINSDFYKSVDKFEFKSPITIKPLSVRKVGKYPHYDLAQFKLPSGNFVEIQVNTDMAIDSKYCLNSVYKNGEFFKYQIVAFNNCI